MRTTSPTPTNASRHYVFTRTGRIDLTAPSAAAVDFRNVSDKLARTIRFNGEVGAISVAQHSVMGAEAIVNETRDEIAAGLFLLHDAHEYVLGDIVSPVANLLTEAVGDAFAAQWALIKARWDEAIFSAAGLTPPSVWTAEMRRAVMVMDQRMCAAEILALYGPRAASIYPPSIRKTPLFREGLSPWPPEKAAERFLASLSRFTKRIFR